MTVKEDVLKTLKWIKNNYLPLSGGTLIGDLNITSNDSEGGQINLKSSPNASTDLTMTIDNQGNGNFRIFAGEGGNLRIFEFDMQEGELSMNGQQFINVLNKLEGNSSSYIKFNNGLQIAFGSVISDSGGTNVTLSIPFNTEKSKSFSSPISTAGNVSSGTQFLSSTTLKVTSSGYCGIAYFVIGFA